MDEDKPLQNLTKAQIRELAAWLNSLFNSPGWAAVTEIEMRLLHNIRREKIGLDILLPNEEFKSRHAYLSGQLAGIYKILKDRDWLLLQLKENQDAKAEESER